MERASDAAIIKRGVDDDRTVVTADLDYPRLLALTGAAKPSLILFRSGDWSEEAIVTAMARLLGEMTPNEIEATIFIIDHNRIRRRRLPIG
jgi:predicted nuclease of predicted toxin-antitoxin system